MLFLLDNLEDTYALAEYIVEHSQMHSLVILKGPLGAGKTTLTQQIAKVLKSSASVSSPTYTLIHEYPGPEGLLVHIDAYRLANAEHLLDLGLDDYLDRARLTIVEWGEALLEHYPDALLVTLNLDKEKRSAVLETSEARQKAE